MPVTAAPVVKKAPPPGEGRAHRPFGTTACLPTLISDRQEVMAAAIAAARSAAGSDGVIGLHVEGPFLNPARKGVHRHDLLVTPQPSDLELLSALGKAAGRW